MLFLDELRKWREQNRAIDELNKMTTRQLNDIGIERSEIKHRIRGK